MTLPRWWRRHFLPIELGAALVIAGVFTIAEVRCGILPDELAALYGALAAVFGSLLGFTIAAVSIIIAVSGDDRLAVLRGSDRYPDLWKTFFSAIRWLGGATLIAFAGLLWETVLVAALASFAILITVFRISRCIWVLERIVAILNQDKRRRGDEPPPTRGG